jgi:cytochrome c-type biogenesis protein CcmF
MLAEFGVMCLVLTMLVAALQASYLVAGRSQSALHAIMLPASWAQTFLMTLALVTLILLRVESDFSVSNVVEHSNRTLPLLYKIVGSWGNHEGSMLLWVLVLVVFGLLLALRTVPHSPLVRTALAVQACLVVGTAGFVLFTSSPFTRLFPPPADGAALNPLLQDVALSIHPPLLYVGYVGFSLVFSLAVAALIHKQVDRDWGALLYPWILVAWSALTVGIGLGSWWAYRELGWGGWWFWDPVENASLLPWLAGTALLHTTTALKKQGVLARWVVLLAIFTFALSMIGTFLVRSGALTSVHSFANDPERGLYILGFMALSIGSGFFLYALRAPLMPVGAKLQIASREGLLLVNNIFFMVATATVLLGTVYPLFVDWLQAPPVSVGAPYYNLTLVPLMIVPLLLAGIAPFIPWKQAPFRMFYRYSIPAIQAVLAVVILMLAIYDPVSITTIAGMGLAAWLAVHSVWLYLKRGKALLPVCIAHLGVAVLIAGITGEAAWKEQKEGWLAPGESVSVGDYTLMLEQLQIADTPNYSALSAHFLLQQDENTLALLKPEFRRYSIRNSSTSESAIYSWFGGDIHAYIGNVSEDGERVATRIYVVPMIHCIWLGFVLMAMGGITALWQKRRI